MKNNDALKKINLILYVELGSAVLFSLLNISFNKDISLISFPICAVYTAICIYFTFFKFLHEENGKFTLLSRKLNEYLPFVLLIAFIFRRSGKNGVAFWVDVISVILWFIIFFLSFVVSSKLGDKHVLEFASKFKIKPEVNKKYFGWAKVGFETAGWIDAFFQGIFVVVIFQIFVIQFYEIPSESMVPTFLIKDKVAVSKIDCGPKFPLTDVGLPDFRKYKRGDTIVLRNPHYKLDRKAEVKYVSSQLITMFTFTLAHTNVDENGEIKADPLVKRITGVPGEQLVMQDGVLYAKTKDHDFEPVALDEKYASWNLNKLSKNVKNKVEYIPLSQQEYDLMINFEEERRNYDLTVAAYNAKELVNKFYKLADQKSLAGDFKAPELFEYSLFKDVQNLTMQLMSLEGGAEWFEKFMTSWIESSKVEKDLYAEANYKLNVMTKITLGNLIVRYAELIKDNVSASLWSSDEVLKENFEMADKLNFYIQSLLDERNMPVFPANNVNGEPQFIPENCYFMMGDNRFNSLDLRHKMDDTLEPLTSYDLLSVKYYSFIAPQYINKKYIIGKPVCILWPTNRFKRLD